VLSSEQINERVRKEVAAISFDLPPRSLFEPVEYTLSLGGKRLRPALTLIACNIWNESIEDAIKPALGLEIFHNFTVMHDDLMDRADMRRNRPTVHRKWSDNAAILSGDAMVIAAYQYIGATKEPFHRAVLELFSQTAMEICCGQQLDMDFERREDVTESDYMEMIHLKTATFIACSLKTGAIIGGASPHDAEQLYRFGVNIGLAFQLRDDLLDVYGDATVFGKNIGGDILCDKKTFLRITATALADKAQIQALQRYNDTEAFTAEDKITAWTALYDSLNIKNNTQDRINMLYKRAINELEQVSAPTAALQVLKTYTDMLVAREY
jgi:geranylgeranyl diphosphate synthase type II